MGSQPSYEMGAVAPESGLALGHAHMDRYMKQMSFFYESELITQLDHCSGTSMNKYLRVPKRSGRKLIFVRDSALRWMLQSLIDDELIMVQVMAWCRQAIKIITWTSVGHMGSLCHNVWNMLCNLLMELNDHNICTWKLLCSWPEMLEYGIKRFCYL